MCSNPKARSTISWALVDETTLTTLYILRSWYSLLKHLTKKTKNKVLISELSATKQVLSMQNSEEAKKSTIWCFPGYMNIWEAWNKSVLEFCNKMTGMSCLPDNLGMYQFHSITWRRGANLLGTNCPTTLNTSPEVPALYFWHLEF